MQGGLIGPLTRRFGEERLMLAGLGLIALGLAVLPFAADLPLLLRRGQRAGARHGSDAAVDQQPDLAPRRGRASRAR